MQSISQIKINTRKKLSQMIFFAPKIKKLPQALKGDFLIFRTLFRVRGKPKNQNELNLNRFQVKIVPETFKT